MGAGPAPDARGPYPVHLLPRHVAEPAVEPGVPAIGLGAGLPEEAQHGAAAGRGDVGELDAQRIERHPRLEGRRIDVDRRIVAEGRAELDAADPQLRDDPGRPSRTLVDDAHGALGGAAEPVAAHVDRGELDGAGLGIEVEIGLHPLEGNRPRGPARPQRARTGAQRCADPFERARIPHPGPERAGNRGVERRQPPQRGLLAYQVGRAQRGDLDADLGVRLAEGAAVAQREARFARLRAVQRKQRLQEQRAVLPRQRDPLAVHRPSGRRAGAAVAQGDVLGPQRLQLRKGGNRQRRRLGAAQRRGNARRRVEDGPDAARSGAACGVARRIQRRAHASEVDAPRQKLAAQQRRKSQIEPRRGDAHRKRIVPRADGGAAKMQLKARPAKAEGQRVDPHGTPACGGRESRRGLLARPLRRRNRLHQRPQRNGDGHRRHCDAGPRRPSSGGGEPPPSGRPQRGFALFFGQRSRTSRSRGSQPPPRPCAGAAAGSRTLQRRRAKFQPEPLALRAESPYGARRPRHAEGGGD